MEQKSAFFLTLYEKYSFTKIMPPFFESQIPVTKRYFTNPNPLNMNETLCLFHCQHHRYWEWSILFPMRTTVVLLALVCLVVLFRRCPGATIGIISGCFATMAVWMILLAGIDMRKPKYE